MPIFLNKKTGEQRAVWGKAPKEIRDSTDWTTILARCQRANHHIYIVFDDEKQEYAARIYHYYYWKDSQFPFYKCKTLRELNIKEGLWDKWRRSRLTQPEIESLVFGNLPIEEQRRWLVKHYKRAMPYYFFYVDDEDWNRGWTVDKKQWKAFLEGRYGFTDKEWEEIRLVENVKLI